MPLGRFLETPLMCTKISAAGNDFLCIDNRLGKIPLEATQRAWIAKLCHRRFGLGADGVLVWESPESSSASALGADLRMRLFNADSSEAEMCGNGLRALCLFAAMNGLKLPLYRIQTQAGHYTARCEKSSAIEECTTHAHGASACITTSMPLAKGFIEDIPFHTAKGVPRVGHYVHVGVPHLLFFLDEDAPYSLEEEGPYFRHHPRFAPEGVNVHFVTKRQGVWHYRSYERGVEAETWACGTGATAIAAYLLRHQLARLPLVLMPFSGTPLTLRPSSMDCHAELELQAEAVALFTLSIAPHA